MLAQLPCVREWWQELEVPLLVPEARVDYGALHAHHHMPPPEVELAILLGFALLSEALHRANPPVHLFGHSAGSCWALAVATWVRAWPFSLAHVAPPPRLASLTVTALAAAPQLWDSALNHDPTPSLHQGSVPGADSGAQV